MLRVLRTLKQKVSTNYSFTGSRSMSSYFKGDCRQISLLVVHSKRKRGKENKMVTMASFLVFILLTSLVIVIDITTYHYSFIEAWGILFHSNVLFGRIILYGTLAIGFISAIIIDIRIVKKKNKKQTV